MKLTDLELLATLENLRLKGGEIDDYTVRVVQSIVAENIGYKNRADWSEKLRESGLVSQEAYNNPIVAKNAYYELCAKQHRSEEERI